MKNDSTKTCLKCGYTRTGLEVHPPTECPRCGAIYEKISLNRLTVAQNALEDILVQSDKISKATKNNPNNILLTTSNFIPGYTVDLSIGVVSSEVCYGINVFRDILTAFTDFFGGRSFTIEDVITNARIEAFKNLRKNASDIGANGIIAVDFKLSQFSGKFKSMLICTAIGTGVKLVKKNEAVN